MLKLFKKISLLGLLAAALVVPGALAASSSPVLDRVVDFKTFHGRSSAAAVNGEARGQ